MKRKMITAALCVAMTMALCACNTTNPAVKNPNGTPAAETPAVETPAPTATPNALEQAYSKLPVTNYDDYVESTVLPEDYIGFQVEKITDADVESYVQEVLENNRVRELKDGAIEEGDIAIIDYTGYLDGVAFEGGTDYSVERVIGDGSFIPGFDEGLVGVKKGETVSLNLTFPVDYHNVEFAGKEVVFEVKVHSIAAQVLPEFTDEFVTELTEGVYTTTTEFKDYARGFLTEERKYTELMDYLVENTTFGKMNEDYIKAALELEKQYYTMYVYGFESVESLEEFFGAENSEVLWAMLEVQIRRYEQERFALYNVAKAENLPLSEDEYTKRVTEYAESLQMTVEDLYKEQDESVLRQSMLMEVALEHLLDNVVEVEKGEE